MNSVDSYAEEGREEGVCPDLHKSVTELLITRVTNGWFCISVQAAGVTRIALRELFSKKLTGVVEAYSNFQILAPISKAVFFQQM